MTTSDVVIKVMGASSDIAHGVVQIDGRRVAEVVFHLAPSNPFDLNSQPVFCDLFRVLLGPYLDGGSNEFVRKTE